MGFKLELSYTDTPTSCDTIVFTKNIKLIIKNLRSKSITA